jgi:hypothetical protein
MDKKAMLFITLKNFISYFLIAGKTGCKKGGGGRRELYGEGFKIRRPVLASFTKDKSHLAKISYNTEVSY